MANIKIGSPNRIDACALSGGNWLTSLPLANIKNRRFSKLARSNGVSLAATQFMIDAGTEIAVDAIALVAHNLDVSAMVRMTALYDLNTPLANSGWVPVWPNNMIDDSLLEWEDDNFWLGTLSQQALAGYRSPFIYFLPQRQVCRYVKVEIDNQSNTDGFVNIGRVFIGSVFTPTYNYSYGASLVVNDASVIETSLTGEEFFESRQRYRVHNFELSHLSKDEAYSYVLDMQRNVGVTGEVLICPNSDDLANLPRSSFIGRLQSIDPVVHDFYNNFSSKFVVKEIL